MEIIYKIKEIYGWIKYFFTRKKYTFKMTDQVKDFIANLPEEDREELMKGIDKLLKNPHIGRPLE